MLYHYEGFVFHRIPWPQDVTSLRVDYFTCKSSSTAGQGTHTALIQRPAAFQSVRKTYLGYAEDILFPNGTFTITARKVKYFLAHICIWHIYFCTHFQSTNVRVTSMTWEATIFGYGVSNFTRMGLSIHICVIYAKVWLISAKFVECNTFLLFDIFIVFESANAPWIGYLLCDRHLMPMQVYSQMSIVQLLMLWLLAALFYRKACWYHFNAVPGSASKSSR